jgi:putative molybdopterin biosynthesis protein
MTPSLMNTREVAEYLRIKERKVYDLVAQRRIPCTRATGKWLFPKQWIDLWLLQQAEEGMETRPRFEPPAIISGSHDPLLDWAVRESASALAVLFNGSLDGLERFTDRQALACGLHVPDPESGEYNTPLLQRRFAAEPVVALEWAWRQQGLMVMPGNPEGMRGLQDARGKRLALRQKEAGSHLLLDRLLQQAGLTLADFITAGPPLRSETEVALAVANGEADTGLGIAAAAQQLRLDFVPLVRERYDLLIWRRQYFEPPFQKLLAFARSSAFKQRAQAMGGYDIGGLGTVRYNASV